MLNEQTRYRIFLALLAVLGSALVWLATSRFGPGLSTDGARYLSTAENIAAGHGIIDYLGLPLVNWPPLYPILLAGISLLTGLDVFIAAQVLNILVFGAIIFLGGIFFERSLPGNWTFAVIATMILASSLPLLEVSANVASDPLFLLSVLLFLLTAQDYIKSPTRNRWILLATIAVLACFLRYAGLALVFSGIAIVFLTWRSNWRKATTEAVAFSFLAGIPIAAWALFHNLPATGTLLGAHRPSDPIGLFVVFIEKIASWFLPESLLRLIPALLIAALMFVILLATSSRAKWSTWVRRVMDAEIFPSAIFFAIYSAMLIFAISYSEHRVPGSQRIHVIILPTLLVLAAVTFHTFAPKTNPTWRKLFLATFAVWMIFPLYRVTTYVAASMQQGDVSYYNLYNTKSLRESDFVAELAKSEIGPNTKVYSNNEAAAWFFLRRRIYRLPRFNVESGDNLASAIQEFDGWPGEDETAILIWFKRELDYKEEVPTPEQLQDYIRLVPTFTGRNGIIYLMDVDLE
jgi:hypothetical protein